MMRWITFILLLLTAPLVAQDLEQLDIKKPKVYLDGSLSAGIRSFGSSRPSIYRNSNFGYLASARINLHIHSFTLPFSYRLGDQLNLPNLPSFQYWGLSPKYKAVQLHIGHRSLRFSDHTLAGIQTYGIGVGIDTKKFKLQIARGTLDRRRPQRIIYNSRILPVKEKKYTAGSIRIGSTRNQLKYAILIAKEQASELDSIPPRNNIVNEFSGKKQLGKQFYVASNIAISYIDKDDDNFIPLEDSTSLLVQANEVLGANPGSNSKVGLLYGGAIGYNARRFALSLDYNHIDRTFETFGRNFQITDVRTYTVKNRLQLFNSHLLINSRIGLQQNNLQDEKASNTTRWITNVNVLARSNAGHIFTANISNFNLDKENLYVVGQDSFAFSYNALTISLSPQLQLGKSRLIANVNYTKNTNIREDQEAGEGQKLQLLSLMYERPLGDAQDLLSIGANYSKISAAGLSEKLYGISLGIQMRWKDKLQFNLNYNPNINVEEATDSYTTHVATLNTNYTIANRQHVFLSAYYQKITGTQGIRENQIRLGYRMQFSTQKENSKNSKI